jgi:hypothetical protein
VSNSALEQAASAARPWQATQGKTQARSGPRPVPRPPLLTASVTKSTNSLSRNPGSKSVPIRCAEIQTAAPATSRMWAT